MITNRSDHSLSHDIKMLTVGGKSREFSHANSSTGEFTWEPQFPHSPTPLPDVMIAQFYDMSLFDFVLGWFMGNWNWALLCLGPQGGFLKSVLQGGFCDE